MKHWNDEVMEIERNNVTEEHRIAQRINDSFLLIRDHWEALGPKDGFNGMQEAREHFYDESKQSLHLNKRFGVGETVYILFAKKRGVVHRPTGFEYLDVFVDGYEKPQSVRAKHVRKLSEVEL